ncbi:MAG: DUF2442 domain-containing protein [Proteobacteria bacterium]|nr:DUF2442 domain-containing protein [Pseudomonadota bacterium]
MSFFAFDAAPLATAVRCTDAELVVTISDGRVLSVPLAWFPRLARASAAQLGRFELLGGGDGIHWPELDEDVSIRGLLEGRPSIEYRAKSA